MHTEPKGMHNVKTKLFLFLKKLSYANTLSTVVLDRINRPLKSSTRLRRKTKEKIKTNGKEEEKDRFITSIRNRRNENGKKECAAKRNTGEKLLL